MTPLARDMTPEDERHWEDIHAWKTKRFHRPARDVIPSRWRERASAASAAARRKAAAAAHKVPHADEFGDMLVRAIQGLTEAGARASSASVRTEAVLEAFRKKGHSIDRLEDIRKLNLDDIRDVKPRLDLAYIAASAVQGAGTGLLASGGTILAAGGAVGTGGVAAAPGISAVLGAIAADTAAGILASNRAVAHVAAYYGYDLDEPAERVFALGVLSVGLADDATKFVAYRELNNIVQALARRQTWKQLNQHQVTRVVTAVYRALGMRLTQRKLAVAVPVVGVVLGAGLNARNLARVTDDAEHLYRERFLREKYGLPPADVDASGTADPVDLVDAPETGGLVDIIDAEVVNDADGR